MSYYKTCFFILILLTNSTSISYATEHSIEAPEKFTKPFKENDNLLIVKLLDKVDHTISVNHKELEKASLNELESFWQNNQETENKNFDNFNYLALCSLIATHAKHSHQYNQFLKERLLNIIKRGESENAPPLAQLNLGLIYKYGWQRANGKKQKANMDKASWYLEKASEQGYAPAQFNLALMYESGWQKVNGKKQEPLAKKAFDLYKKAALQEYAPAQYNLSLIYESGSQKTSIGPNLNKAFEWLVKAAEQGYARAQYCLGDMYYQGQQKTNGVNIDPDMEKAFEWFSKAAEQGMELAQHNLAVMFQKGWKTARGENIDPDMEKAFYWYEKAAFRGVPESQNNLGHMYEYGWQANGAQQEPNLEKAFELYRKASAQGLSEAQLNLTNFMKEKTRSLSSNNQEFLKWLFSSNCLQALNLNIKSIKTNVGPYFFNQVIWGKSTKVALTYGIKKAKKALGTLFCKEIDTHDTFSVLNEEAESCLYLLGHYVGITNPLSSYGDGSPSEILYIHFENVFNQLLSLKRLISHLKEENPGFLTTAQPKIEMVQINSPVIRLLELKGQNYYSYGEKNCKETIKLEGLLSQMTESLELETCVTLLSAHEGNKEAINQLNGIRSKLRKMADEVQDFIFSGIDHRNRAFRSLFEINPS